MSRRSGTDRRRTLNFSSKNKYTKARWYTLSADAQAALSNLLEDVIENTLEDAKIMAENAGKNKVSIDEIECALKKLCKTFCTQNSMKTFKPSYSTFHPLKRRFGSN